MSRPEKCIRFAVAELARSRSEEKLMRSIKEPFDRMISPATGPSPGSLRMRAHLEFAAGLQGLMAFPFLPSRRR